MLDLFQGALGQSVCSLLICLFLPFFSLLHITSEPTGGWLLFRSHGNCPRKKPRVFDGEEEEEEKKRNPSLTFGGAAPWTSVGGFSFAKRVF